MTQESHKEGLWKKGIQLTLILVFQKGGILKCSLISE